MDKTYSGIVTIKFYAQDIECDGTLDDFVNNLLEYGWNDELMEIDGEITEKE